MTERPRSHQICEPEIHESLDWDLDLIVACLEVIRQQLPTLLNIDNENLEYDLVSLEKPHGPPYPVIGIHCLKEQYEGVPDFFDLSEKATRWVKSIGLEKLKKQAALVKAPSWQELKKARHI